MEANNYEEDIKSSPSQYLDYFFGWEGIKEKGMRNEDTIGFWYIVVPIGIHIMEPVIYPEKNHLANSSYLGETLQDSGYFKS